MVKVGLESGQAEENPAHHHTMSPALALALVPASSLVPGWDVVVCLSTMSSSLALDEAYGWAVVVVMCCPTCPASSSWAAS
jgi:hypothetical protein